MEANPAASLDVIAIFNRKRVVLSGFNTTGSMREAANIIIANDGTDLSHFPFPLVSIYQFQL